MFLVLDDGFQNRRVARNLDIGGGGGDGLMRQKPWGYNPAALSCASPRAIHSTKGVLPVPPAVMFPTLIAGAAILCVLRYRLGRVPFWPEGRGDRAA